MKKAATYLKENRDELIGIMSQETGGTLLKSNVELDLTLEVLEERRTLLIKFIQSRKCHPEFQVKQIGFIDYHWE